MDHAYIEANGLIELYHRGALSPEEEARFEAHFVDCARCTEELEAALGFQAGIRQMVAEDALQAQAAARVGILASLAQLLRQPQAAILFAGLLAAVVLGTGWLGSRLDRLRSEAELARADADSWQQRFEDERTNVAELERRLAEAETGGTPDGGTVDGGELDELRTRLDEAIAARDRSARELERSRRPRWDTPVFILSIVRGGSEPAAVIDLTETGEWLSLAVDVDIDPRIESYQVEVSGGPDQRRWHRDGLHANAFETLMVTFPANAFRAGDYRLEVEGLQTSGGTVEIEGFDFRVIDGD